MAGDDRFYDDHYDDSQQDEPPSQAASLIFTELMRKAANADVEAREREEQARLNAENPTYGDYGESVVTVDGQEAPVMPEEERERLARIEAQRLRRVNRRKERRKRQNVGMFGGIVRTFLVVVISGALMATILSLWIDPDALDSNLRANLNEVDATNESGNAQLVAPSLSTPPWMINIGIIAGHSGPFNDPGAVCYDANNEPTLTELQINMAVAQQVYRLMLQQSYDAELLEEFDPRLDNYDGALLISIHANDCSDYGEFVSGYLVSFAESRPENGEDYKLQECIAHYYEAATNLPRRFGFTRDVTDYHVFREINVNTPSVILELGFMLGDQEFLTTQTDVMAAAIVQGIMCYLNEEYTQILADDLPTPVPDIDLTPVATP